MRILASAVHVQVKLLLDENLSPAIVGALSKSGVDVVHLRDRGLLGATDAHVLECAYVEDRVLVTLNVGDFEKLARSREIHAGIALIERAGLLRDEQIEIVRKIVTAIAAHGSMVNELLRVAEGRPRTFVTVPPV